LGSLSNTEFNNLMNNIRNTVEFNQKHFFGELFENTLMDELHNNFNLALHKQRENFKINPAGTFFQYHWNSKEINRYARLFNIHT
jgi:hypothetical protein